MTTEKVCEHIAWDDELQCIVHKEDIIMCEELSKGWNWTANFGEPTYGYSAEPRTGRYMHCAIDFCPWCGGSLPTTTKEMPQAVQEKINERCDQ